MTNVTDMVYAPIHRGELLLELLSEEIPARMQRDGLDQLKKRVSDFLSDAYLAPRTVDGYVTPRRLTVIATGIPQQQDATDATPDERRGPRVGAPDAAVKGFCRSVGLAPEDLEQRDGYYFAKIERPGSPAIEILPKVIAEAIEQTVWPKSMRFPGYALHWVRPLVSVICLFDGEVVPLALGQVPVGRVTHGHRFLSSGEISVANATEYRERLETAHVVLDWGIRRKTIEDNLTVRAKDLGLAVKPDPGLLDEVTGLAEFPVVLIGAIDEASMALPPEVLATAMRTHQKYFSCVRPDGAPAPRFLFVANNRTADDGRTIVAGNERVLRARLADARFFWDQDLKVRLEDRVEALKDSVYYAKLGSVYDKVERVEKLAAFLASELYPAVTPAKAGVQGGHSDTATLDSRFRGNDNVELGRLAQRAAHLAKADLSTGMVGEFPELQGVMGRYYALNDGEDPRVAEAIAEHYKPQGPGDSCPIAPVSVSVGLADKIDTLVAFFRINEKPTGSRDPFALRRSAQGIIRIILESELRLSLFGAFAAAARELSKQKLTPPIDLQEIIALGQDLCMFVIERLKVHLREEGVRHDLIAAAFEQVGGMGIARAGKYEDDLIRLLTKVGALKGFLATDDGANLLTAYRRASNIVSIEERRDKWEYGQVFEGALLQQDEERSLARALDEINEEARALLNREQFEAAMAVLAGLRRPVDEFFEKVTVNTVDKDLRANRLRLLTRIRNTMDQVADFSQIEG